MKENKAVPNKLVNNWTFEDYCNELSRYCVYYTATKVLFKELLDMNNPEKTVKEQFETVVGGLINKGHKINTFFDLIDETTSLIDFGLGDNQELNQVEYEDLKNKLDRQLQELIVETRIDDNLRFSEKLTLSEDILLGDLANFIDTSMPLMEHKLTDVHISTSWYKTTIILEFDAGKLVVNLLIPSDRLGDVAFIEGVAYATLSSL